LQKGQLEIAGFKAIEVLDYWALRFLTYLARQIGWCTFYTVDEIADVLAPIGHDFVCEGRTMTIETNPAVRSIGVDEVGYD